jgi:hypothetical protein
MLAGLVIWKEVNKTRKNWIIKKLSKDPMEMFLKYWENKKIKKNSILTKTGHFAKFSKPEIQISKADCTCRGHEMGDVYEPVDKDTLQYVKKNPWGSRPRERSFKHSNLDYRLVKQISNDTIEGIRAQLERKLEKKCARGVEKGNIRLSIRLVNPAKPYYIGRDWESGRATSGYHLKESKVTYYYCVHCSSEYISSETRYSLIKKWWPKALKLEREAKEVQIKEQKKKEVEKTEKIEAKKAEKKKAEGLGPIIYLADKIVKSKWGGAAGDKPAMKKMAASMKKGKVSGEILEEVLWAYMFHADSTARAAAKKAFMELAPEDAVQAVKKNWKASSRNSKKLEKDLGKLGKSLSHTNINFVNLLIKVLGDDDVPSYLYKKDQNYQDKYPTIVALGIIGDAQAAEPLGQLLGDDGWKRNASDAITSSLLKIGEPAVVPLVKALTRASDSAATRIIANTLTKLKWKPETDELLAFHLVAMKKWSDCAKLGAPAIEPLVKFLEKSSDWFGRTAAVKALGTIGDERAVEPLIKQISKKYGWLGIGKGYHKAVVSAITQIGEPAIIPLGELIAREGVTEILQKIARKNLKGDEKKNVLRFLESDDPAMVRMGASLLKGAMK